MTKLDNLALLIPSCDKYRDVWPYFFKLLFKYWPEVKEHPIYLISNYAYYPDNNVINITIGEEKGWSDNVTIALEKIKNDYIMIVLEDFLLTDRVDTKTLLEYFAAMKTHSAGYLRLMANPPPNFPCEHNNELGVIKKTAAYRTSLQLAIWKKEVLQSLLLPGESPWGFELNGSIRSKKFSEPFLSIQSYAKQPIMYFPNSIVRGMWVIEAVQYLRKQGFQDTLSRPIETRFAAILRRNWFRDWISKLLVQPLRKLCKS